MTTQVQADQLSQTIDAVRADLRGRDEPTVAAFVADTALADNDRTSVRIRDFAFTVDEPPAIGGADGGPTPVELVLAALGACQEIVYATYARLLGIPLEAVDPRVEGQLDLRGFFGVADVPAGFHEIVSDVAIDSPARPEQIARLAATVNAHCPVLDILRRPAPVAGRLTHNGAALQPAPSPEPVVGR